MIDFSKSKFYNALVMKKYVWTYDTSSAKHINLITVQMSVFFALRTFFMPNAHIKGKKDEKC